MRWTAAFVLVVAIGMGAGSARAEDDVEAAVPPRGQVSIKATGKRVRVITVTPAPEQRVVVQVVEPPAAPGLEGAQPRHRLPTEAIDVSVVLDGEGHVGTLLWKHDPAPRTDIEERERVGGAVPYAIHHASADVPARRWISSGLTPIICRPYANAVRGGWKIGDHQPRGHRERRYGHVERDRVERSHEHVRGGRCYANE